MPDFQYESTGGLTLSSTSEVNATMHFTNQGGFVLSNSAFNPVVFNGTYVISEPFAWDTLASIEIELQVAWDVGDQILRYYQIEGKCTPPTCDATGFNIVDPKCDNGERFLTIIAATDLSDLCSKMKQQVLNYPIKWPIARIRRWSRPVSTLDIAAQTALGIDNSCNTLEDQMFCHVPECIDLCLDEDTVVSIGISAFIQDRFFNYVARGGLIVGGYPISNTNAGVIPVGGFVLGSSADVISSSYHYVASGGLVLSSDAVFSSIIWHYDPVGGLMISGEAPTESAVYHYSSNGGLTLGGSAVIKSHHKYNIQNGIIALGGSTVITRVKYELGSSGGLVLGGNYTLKSNTFVYSMSGGLTLGGTPSIKMATWNYTASSGLTLGGTPNIGFRYVAEGGLALGGSATSNQINHMIGSGGLTLGGNIFVNYAPTAHLQMSGGLTLGGSSDSNFHALGTLNVYMVADSSLELIEPVYPINPADSVVLPADTADVTANCGCNPIPNLLNMSHNIDTGSILQDFLIRNNLKLPERLNLIYNKTDAVWRTNYHFVGVGSNANEKWTILFEWGCSSSIGGESLGTTLWKFSVLVKRELNGDQVETRILYTFPTANACVNNAIQFAFKINTQTKSVILPSNLLIRDSIIYDNVGLFVGKTWEKNPNISIDIFENIGPTTSPTLDIKPIFPN